MIVTLSHEKLLKRKSPQNLVSIMPTHATVVFQPDGKKTKISLRTIVLEAAKEANVAIRSECGGKGSCGKCKIIVRNSETVSEITKAERDLLSNQEIKFGYRLACQTKILKNTWIALPQESRLTAHRIQTEGFEKEVRLEPSTRKICVKLRKPTLSDVRPDLERLLVTLEKFMSNPKRLQVGLSALKTLPAVLRNSNWHVTVTIWNNDRIVAVEPNDTRSKCYGLAVDVGTSKIVGHLVDMVTGATLGIEALENPQIMHGEDVISRVAYAKRGKTNLNELQKLVVKGINEVLQKVCALARVNPQNVYEAILVGNTAMHHLLLGINPQHLAFSPFAPAVKRQLNIAAKELRIETNPNGTVTFLPIIAGFVGADAVADLIATDICENNKLSMLIDIGTNTEIFLGNKDDVLCCSCASGPAFEGAHIRHGMKATTGAIEKVRIKPANYEVEYETIDNAKPAGMCGSAMIDIVAELLKHNLVDKRGRFLPEPKTERLRKSRKEAEFIIVPKTQTATGREVTISQKDINEMQLAKAAIYTGCKILLKEKNLTENKLERILIAGAFGNYLNVENAKNIRMIPDIPTKRIHFIGNAAITGAKMALRSRKILKRATEIAEKTRYLELANHREFNKHFMEALFLA